VRHLVRQVGSWPFRFLSPAARRRMVQAVTTASAHRHPEDALRELLQIDEDLTGAVNELAVPYGGGVHVKHRLMKYHDFFVSRLTAGQRVLDVGCGTGAVAFSAASRAGAVVVGIDKDSANIASARQLFTHPGLMFLEGTAPADVPAGGFDVVIASNVLEHIADRPAFLSGIEERTRAARWLIRVPMTDRDWRVPLRAELGLRSFSDPTHHIEYTRGTFENEMRAAGFGIRHLQVNWGEIWADVEAPQ
jgi:2-polyprenyl-3-methyl-5-hydroxy-6-metoxy-1,4-benzoquinol methylase